MYTLSNTSGSPFFTENKSLYPLMTKIFTDWMMAKPAEDDYSLRVADDFDKWLAGWTWNWNVRTLE
jgi:hypothetical protein